MKHKKETEEHHSREYEDGKVVMDKKEFINEHKRLIRALKSPAHRDDLTEAQKQIRELKRYSRKGPESE